MPSGAGVQPPCGAMISWYILGGQLWKGTRIHRACAHGRSSLPETHHRCTPHPSNSPDPRLVCCQGGGLPTGHTLPAHKQEDTRARCGPSPGGSGLAGPRSQRPESTGLCESLVKPSKGWQKGVNPRLCRWPGFQISLAFTEVELILP